MIPFQIYQNKSKISDKTYLHWYARAVSTETVDNKKLADKMSLHNTPFSNGAVEGILTDMVSCIKELLLEGKNVKIDDLAIFSTSIKNKEGGVTSKNDYNVQDHVKAIKMKALATGELGKTLLNNVASLKESAMYERAKDISTTCKLYNVLIKSPKGDDTQVAREGEKVILYNGNENILTKVVTTSGDNLAVYHGNAGLPYDFFEMVSEDVTAYVEAIANSSEDGNESGDSDTTETT